MSVADLVDVAIQANLSEVDDFGSLVVACAGAYPVMVRDRLARLAHSAHPDAERAMAILATAVREWSRRPYWDRRLPLPHPLDDDWRFSPDTARRLLEIGLRSSKAGRRLLLAAVPTLAVRAIDLGLADQVVFAARLDDPVTIAVSELGAGKLDVREIRDDLLGLECGAAICDPPWADIPAGAIVRNTSAGVTADGHVFVCIPGDLTGASSAEVLASLTGHLREFAFSSAEFVAFELRYETPFFEVNALTASGIRNYPPDWRTGRLVKASVARDRGELGPFPAREWREMLLDGMRVFTRNGSPHVMENAGFEIVPSISRQHPVRGTARFWTSGNRCSASGLPVATDFPHGSSWSALRKLALLEQKEASSLLRREP